jgi:ABC-type methionine transport system ATPase subunit
MDEPTSALNDALADKILDYIVNEPHLTVVCISHNSGWVNSFDKHVELG